jgi:Ca-activated chloride channel family protein
MPFSNLQGVVRQSSWRTNLRIWLVPILRGLALLCLTVSLARPQRTLQEQDIKADGIDIILSMDLSSSMLAQDFRPDRLKASQKVAADFVEHREFDRIGLVVFSGEAFTQCPLTSDHEVLNHFLAQLQCGQLEDGTAIGMGLATAVNRLKDSKAKSKIIILLTDGVNNAGYIEPNTAAQLAKEFGIKVYTIGVGNAGQAYAPIGRRSDGEYVFGYVPVEIDENLMIQIAQQTGGRYFRATDEHSLQKIYTEIDQLEKTEMDVTSLQRHLDLYGIWLYWSLAFLLSEFILRYTLLRSIP